MPGTEPLIANVSDTARWVAAYRADESDRPDALFHDPLAGRLAGERGRAIAAAAPRIMRGGWSITARTKLIDDIIATAVGEGCDRVLNLAAGFDTRPYRLDLPEDFSWVEADLPALLAEKEQLLAGETPRCRLTRHAVDLSDASARSAFLDEAVAGASKALVLTEGLLMYLDEAAVVGLSQTLVRPEIAWWLLDVASAAIVETMREKSAALLRNAPFQFGPTNGIAFFEDLGWTTLEDEPIFQTAHRLRRLPWFLRPLGYLPGKPDSRNPGRKPWSAVVRFTR